jgi:ring-1,2-phenylacetyl-CoA epoxidase subunit PaaE
MSFYSLPISRIQRESTDAVSIFFDIPTSLKDEFVFIPGQYLTLKATIAGEEVRRSYSISTVPDQQTIGVTVKKLQGGLMSSYLHDVAKTGDVIDVMPPDGHFVVKTRHDISRDHYFFAAGSGITPIMSMIRTILEEEPRSTCYLLYGNRDESNIIFKEAIDQMVEKYLDQFYVQYVVSKPSQQKSSGISGLFGRKTSDWKGATGRIDHAKCADFIYEYAGRHAERHYYICGPGDFIQSAETYLLSQSIDKKSIHKEFFGTGTPAETHSGAVEGSVNVTLRGESISIQVPKGKTILEALVALKKDPPYSCTSGACSTCIAKVTEGEVVMDTCYALDEDEVEAGYILTCQAHPKTAQVTLTYDID